LGKYSPGSINIAQASRQGARLAKQISCAPASFA
jgi:hypothetical protein